MTERPYIGRNGRRYTAAVEHWDPRVIKALGIRLADDGKPADMKTMKKEIQP